MARQLKRWESPRQEGRNDKGKGGSARQRQRRKQMQMLRNKLKNQSDHQKPTGGSQPASPIFLGLHVDSLAEPVPCIAVASLGRGFKGGSTPAPRPNQYSYGYTRFCEAALNFDVADQKDKKMIQIAVC